MNINNVTQEFLETNGFSKVQFGRENCYIRFYTKWYALECNLEHNAYVEYSVGFSEALTEEEFIATISQHEQATNQYK